MLGKSVFRHFAPLIALSVWGTTLLPLVAHAEVPLKQAVIAALRNKVELILQNQAPRSAKVQDTMAPGDALTTARAALAELRFNDGSLARVGGQALFHFVPNSRTFRLSNGTLLLLVPPGRGQTRIQTPNAAAGIRGSALFVRYLPDTDVTLIGALTESGIEITNRDRSQTQLLGAGQIAVVVNNQIKQIYRFDLNTFYATSDLVKGLELQRPATMERSQTPTDPAIAAVRAETSEAVALQATFDRLNDATAANRQSLDPNTKTPQADQATAPLTTPFAQPVTGSDAIALPATSLLTPPTVALPTAFPPTVALPTTIPLVNPPAASPVAPGLTLPQPPIPGQNAVPVPGQAQ